VRQAIRRVRSSVLLHGFPGSSHQYRNLLAALADRFHVISPDYPGFGNSDIPDPATFAYTFDKISAIVEDFLKLIVFSVPAQGQRCASRVVPLSGPIPGLRAEKTHLGCEDDSRAMIPHSWSRVTNLPS
jgi:alpha/beta hydrolase fold